MSYLAQLKNTSRSKVNVKRVGRGTGCKKGKTCGRGTKGYKARAGYKRRRPQEGGQLPLFRKMPTRGFTRGRFLKKALEINLSIIEEMYKDGETVNLETLKTKGLFSGAIPGGIRILGQGELKKKVKIVAHHFSKTAKEKLEKSGIEFSEISKRKTAE